MDRVITFSLFQPKVHQRYRSYDLYNTPDRYWYNIPAVVACYKTLHPDFALQIYVSEDCSTNKYYPILLQLYKAGLIELIISSDAYQITEPAIWRFQPIFDTTKDVVFCRDIDSLPTSKEIAANNIFLGSDNNVCTIRSHQNHDSCNTRILAGLSGYRPNKIKHTYSYNRFKRKYYRAGACIDQIGLIEYIFSLSGIKFLDFAISSEGHEVCKPIHDCMSIVNPTLEYNSLLLNELDKITVWSGEPIDSRGSKLRTILAYTGQTGSIIEECIQESDTSKLYYERN